MEKTIQIDGKNINFRCTAGTLRRYRNQFNREFLADLSKLAEIKEDMTKFTFEPFENIVWAMAKTADNSIPDMQTWFDSFTDFSVVDVFMQLEDIITGSLKSKN